MVTSKQHSTLVKWLVLGFLFLLPWQTRYIWEAGTLAGQYWEYVSYSLYATELLLWAIILLFFALLVRDRQNWYALVVALTTPDNKKRVLVVLVIIALFGIVFLHSPNHFLSYYYLFHALEAACLFFCITQLQINSKQLLVAFWLGGVGQGMLAIVQFATQQVLANKWLGLAAHSAGHIGDFVVETNSERWLRAYGSFGSPNMLGAYLALILVVGLLLYNTSSSRQKIGVSLGQIAVVAGLVLSFSRGAWLAALVGISTLIFLTIRERQTVKFIIFQSLLYLLLIAGLAYLFQPLFLSRLEASGRIEARSINERTQQYAEAKRLFFSYPWLGVGPGEYTLALYQSLGSPTSSSSVQPAHNVYLLMLAEFGIPLFAVLAAIGSFIIRSVWLRNPLGLSLVSVMAVSGVFEHFWWTLYTGVVLVWVVFGLSYKKINHKDQENTQKFLWKK